MEDRRWEMGDGRQETEDSFWVLWFEFNSSVRIVLFPESVCARADGFFRQGFQGYRLWLKEFLPER